MINGLSTQFLAPAAAVTVAALLLTGLLRLTGIPIDRPNERSLHSRPVPRVGGLAVVPSIAIGWCFVPGAVPWAICLPAVVLFVLSFVDDSRGLQVLVRLAVHFLAALAVSTSIVFPGTGAMSAILATVAIAWMTNLFNFMDGSDGLAGGMAVIGFSGFAIAAWMGGAIAFALACSSVAAATAAFLCFNFHPARVFLGDAGSIPLGFLAAALGIQGWLAGLWPFWFPAVVFSPFVVDASATLLYRAARRQPVWRAHREHYYQRLVRIGWGHRRTAIAEYGLMIACVLVAIAGVGRSVAVQSALLTACTVGYLVLMRAIDRAWRAQPRNS